MIHTHNLKMTTERTINLLGALSQAVTDRVRAVVESEVGHSGETPAALTLIGHEPGLSIDVLCKILNLSHSGAVRLIDRLQSDGLVERRKGTDGRAVALFLTETGETLRVDILKRREAALMPILAVLSVQDQKRLTALLEKLLSKLPQTETEAFSICRLCDEGVCQNCPMEKLDFAP
jgi:MarR family transcriptional regulator, negative regulator of the multidrug operon emrRAB